MYGNSKSPNGMIMAVFAMCPNELEFGGMLSPDLLWRKLSGHQGGVQSRQCAARDIGRGQT
jgi:hypothetical protein